MISDVEAKTIALAGISMCARNAKNEITFKRDLSDNKLSDRDVACIHLQIDKICEELRKATNDIEENWKENKIKSIKLISYE